MQFRLVDFDEFEWKTNQHIPVCQIKKFRDTECVATPDRAVHCVATKGPHHGAAVTDDEAELARNAISVCSCIVRHLSDDRRGAGGSYNRSGRDCISLLLLSPPPPLSLSLTLFMILLVTVQGIGFRTLRSFLYFFITEMK